MGICNSANKALCVITSPTAQQPNDSISSLLHFDRVVSIHVQVKNPSTGTLRVDRKATLALTEPVIAYSSPVAFNNRQLWVSGCVLPGMNTKGGSKVCQDAIVMDICRGALLLCEMDGHGVGGELVAQHCQTFAVNYFRAHISSALEDPVQFLTELNEQCDKSLNSEIDCQAAGCTAVMMLFCKGTLYFSCIGDSRAMLATSSPPSQVAACQPARGDDKSLLAEIKHRRSVSPETTFVAVQMTQDQKPEDPTELSRIRKAGGVVMRLEDNTGRRVGPYRVWKVEGMYPGLAMSRSFGDAIAHEIGVISTPIISSHTETSGMDFFLVLASDGVWDVMENQEVCDFVEAYRHKSVRGVQHPKQLTSVQPDTVTIAQLLCEEARARWIKIVATEDVNIDDISCLVLELQVGGERKRRAPQRTIAPRKDIEDVPGLDRAVRHKTAFFVDPLRDAYTPLLGPEESMARSIVEDEPSTEAVVQDPRRSSVSLIQLGMPK